MLMPALTFLAVAVLGVAAFAQTTDAAPAMPPGPPPGVPASTNVRDAQFPRILSDQRIAFRLRAPEATSVAVMLCGHDDAKPEPMVKSADGEWTFTTPPADVGFHYYWFVVDGATVSDPGSDTFFGWGRQCSGVEVPAPDAAFYALHDVPHGDVRTIPYFSKITGAWRQCVVYCPPGYDDHPAERFPVLYLQHGSGEDQTGWTKQGHMAAIMDNLLAAHQAQPMLVVMDCGYAVPIAPAAEPAAAPPTTTHAGWRGPPNAFDQVVVQELIPLIDGRFRTRADRDHRAIAGLSMGSGQALQIALSHMDLFSVLGLFSGGPRRGFDIKTSFGGVLADPAAFNARMHTLFIGVGSEERFTPGIRDFDQTVNKAGIKAVYYESPGTMHEWLTWRRCLHQFVPLLFRQK